MISHRFSPIDIIIEPAKASFFHTQKNSPKTISYQKQIECAFIKRYTYIIISDMIFKLCLFSVLSEGKSFEICRQNGT
jgi:hypothetical protein